MSEFARRRPSNNMSLKIKPKFKRQRRGNRLIVTIGDTRQVFVTDGKRMSIVEIINPDTHIRVLERSSCGRLSMIRYSQTGVEDREVVIWKDGDGDARTVACRFADHHDCPWFFDHDGRLFVSTSDASMVNTALVVSIAGEDKFVLPMEVAEFLDVSPIVCDMSKLSATHDEPRFAKLRDFDFRIEDLTAGIHGGRRAQNAVLHKLTNYDDMIEAAGGPLCPEVYQKAWKGVDVMVTGTMLQP